jgi:hypothetical protein
VNTAEYFACVVTPPGYTVTISDTIFQTSDVGRRLEVLIPGVSGAACTIATFVNSTQVTVTGSPSMSATHCALGSTYRVDNPRRDHSYVTAWNTALDAEIAVLSSGSLSTVIDTLFELFYPVESFSGSNGVGSSHVMTAAGQTFTQGAHPVIAGDLLEIAGKWWWVTGATDTTITTEGDALPAGPSVYMVWSQNSFFSEDIRKALMNILNLIAEGLTSAVATLPYSIPDTSDPEHGDPTNTYVTARKAVVEAFVTSLTDAFSSFENAVRYVDMTNGMGGSTTESTYERGPYL